MACLPLSGCGQYLGDYTLEKVEVVRDLPKPFGGEVEGYGEYLAISLASTTSLTAIGDRVDGVYVNADFCPLRDSHQLVALGPVSDNGEDLSLPSAASSLKRHGDGRFWYRIFLVSAHPMPGVQYGKTAMDRPRYDLRTANQDVCLRLFAPGYNLVPSQSQTVTVPAELIAAALRQN